MTFLVCVGKWGGFHFHKDSESARLALGFIAFWWLKKDFEEVCARFQRVLERLEEKEKIIANLKVQQEKA